MGIVNLELNNLYQLHLHHTYTIYFTYIFKYHQLKLVSCYLMIEIVSKGVARDISMHMHHYSSGVLPMVPPTHGPSYPWSLLHVVPPTHGPSYPWSLLPMVAPSHGRSYP